MSIDLTTHYGSLQLKSPIVVGACPLTAQEQMRIAIESSGAGAMVLPSLFEEQVIRWNAKVGHALSQRDKDLLEAAERMQVEAFCNDAETYLSIVNRAGSQDSIPVIASVSGYTVSGWMDFAGELQGAGAHAIELNINQPPPLESAGPNEVEDAVVEAVREMAAKITIPLFVKLGREYTSMPHLCRRLLSGAQGLVLYGRLPDIDICLDSLALRTNWQLTPSGSISQLLGSIMRTHAYCPAMPLAASGGIGHADDVIKALLAGADVAMVTSAIYREGPDVIRTLIDGLVVFMERHHMQSIEELQEKRLLEFTYEEERTKYMKALSARPSTSETHDGSRAMHGDRWGHPDLGNR